MSENSNIETESIGHIVTADELVMDEAIIIREQERMAYEKKKKIAAKRRNIVLGIIGVIIIAGVVYIFWGRNLLNKETETTVKIELTENQKVTFVKVDSINGNEIDYTVLETIETEETVEEKTEGSETTSEADESNVSEIPTTPSSGNTNGNASEQGNGSRPSFSGGEGQNPFGGSMPEGFDPSSFSGQAPEGFDSSSMPEGFDPSSFGGQMPGGQRPDKSGSESSEASESTETSEETQPSGQNTEEQTFAKSENGRPSGGFDMSKFSGSKPEGFDSSSIPEGSDAGSFSGQAPEGFDSSSMPEGFNPGNFGGQTSDSSSGSRGNRTPGSGSRSAILTYDGVSYNTTEEKVTVLIPVGTVVTTKLGTETTFSRIASGDCLGIVTEMINGVETIISVYIVG